MGRLFAILGAAILAAQIVAAHSPIVEDGSARKSKDDPFQIVDPEHSTAIYSFMTGAPHYYRIEWDKPFRFYVGMSQAKLDACDMFQTFSFDILDANFTRIDGRDGDAFEWWPWYESFGRSWYWVGPEIGKDFRSDREYPAGTYYIKVFNATNTGRYVLAVGDDERFGLRTVLGILLDGTVSKTREGWWDNDLCPKP